MKRLKYYSDLLKLEHTLFALPFGLASIILLFKEPPSGKRIFLILLALILARTSGMAFNRLLDKEFDTLNPRTQFWPHAQGLVKEKEIKIIIFLTSLGFVLTCALINKLAFLLSPAVILLLFLYPLGKRFIYYPHLILGLIYLLIPVGVDIALNATISLPALLLGGAMATWVAGFDILYSLQDYEFDLRIGLKSLAVRFGIKRAIWIARIFHIFTFFFLLFLGLLSQGIGKIYFIGLLGISLFLIYEHSLISERDLSKLNKAFFTVNGYISIVFFLTVLLDRIISW